ncbi:glutamyl-tRNA reductase [Aliikangiella marina]|uniref:Glutamyl-tRNA reductase n=1 Tax=Aliikangiella marina TaxID=1712262 RepID=A0A545TGY9_9GAMM|nr:glutamyl-tRNA reductase [Aliikangiella marina]TQV76475.1 glutamyl-tRNA reductase [Aliikangiella marina]
MPVSIFGINHKTAPVEIREKVAFSPESISDSLNRMLDGVGLEEVAIISTCNRMEVVYRDKSSQGQAPDKAQEASENLADKITQWLADEHKMSGETISEYAYSYSGEEAVNHIMRVACGLDSMVLGEPQILGQVKDAFGYAKNAGTIGLVLNKLFQQTFSLAKQVRTDTQIGESAVSVAYAAVTLAKRIFANFGPVKALFIGAGETIELAARHLSRQGVVQMSVANRTVERAQKLADEFGATAYGLSSLPELVASADIIISSTASPVPVIGKGLMEKAIKQRRHRPVFMVDLAVPRDIEPEVSDLNDVYLYTVDDMQDVIKENIKVREEAALEAQDIIAVHGQKYFNWLQSLSSVSLMKDFRTQFDDIKNSELERSLSKLSGNQEAQKVLEEFANRLTQKFMHSPSKMIRQAGESNEQKVLEILAEAFDLKKQDRE